MNHRVVRKLIGGRRLLLVVTGVTAFAVPLLLAMWNAPTLRAQSRTAGSTLQTHDITGAWQGSLRTGDREQRLVVLRDSAVQLVDVLAGVSPAGANCPVGTVVISGDGAGD